MASMRNGALAAIVIVACWVSSAAQTADRRLVRPNAPSRRVALVVGNNAYKSAALKNAIADAKAITRALQDTGFEVNEVTDVTLRQLNRALDAFAGSLRPDDLALFYYSGHGIQVEGENYLLPVDFEAVDAVDVKYESYSASRVQEKLGAARVKLLILDACRDNPFAGTRSGTRGLATMSAQGTLIAFATGPGQTASDNPQGQNGLFTEHLLRVMRQPGLGLSELFRTVRIAVHEASAGRQSPWVFDNLLGDLVIRPGTVTDGGSAPVRQPVEDAATLALRAELTLWDSIKDSRSAAVYEDYLRRYPGGQFSVAARERINGFRAPAAVPPASSPVETTRVTSIPRNEPLVTPPANFRPRSPDVIYVPTPSEVVGEMLRVAKVGRNDVVFDLGSGDGRIPITAARQYGARAVGVDIDPQRTKEAMANAKAAGMEGAVQFVTADLFETDLRQATVVTLYLLPSLNQKLRPKLLRELRPGARIVSHAFDMGDWPPDQTFNVNGRTIYLWTVPNR